MPPLKTKARNILSLSRKAELIQEYDDLRNKNIKPTHKSLAEKYNVSPATVLTILKRRKGILAFKEQAPEEADNRTKLYKRNMLPVEDALMVWFRKQRDQGLCVLEKNIRAEALVIWTAMRPHFREGAAPKECHFSAGWCSRFKKNRMIKLRVGHGESGSVDLEAVRGRIDEIKTQLLHYDLEDIYNCDETGLYLRAISNKSLDSQHFRGRKVVRSTRVSVLFCSNSTGSDKRKALVLSKHKPRGLSSAISNDIDIDTSGNGYMEKPVFYHWLRSLDDDMRRQNRHIALMIDGVGSHNDSETIGLTNIAIIRLPANTTSLTQPMDQGIIRSFKAYYSQEMLHAIYCWRLKNKDGDKNSIDNKDLWICIANAWRKVTEACIRNCFAKAPILSNPQSNDLKELGTESAQHQVETLQQELIDKYRHLEDEIASQNDIGVLNYLDMIYSDGPDEDMLSAIQETMAKDEFKSLFLEYSVDHIHDIDEDDEETEDEEEDSDFEISDASLSDNNHGEPTLVLRSMSTYFRDNERLSPPSSPLDEEYYHCNSQSLIESLDRFKSAIMAMPERDPNAFEDFVFVRRVVDTSTDCLELRNPNMDTNIYNDIVAYSDALLYPEHEDVEEEDEEEGKRTPEE